MALTEHYHTKFEEGNFYHIYNRSVDRKPLFKNEGNYKFFLKKYDEYLSPVLETYAYCLLGNHFHLLVRVVDRSAIDLTTFQKLSNLKIDAGDKTIHDIVSHQFRKFFQSYAMAFNKQQNRTGTLFQTPFKRALIQDSGYYTRVVNYIHENPQMHQLVDDFREWKWSSYGRMLMDKASKLKKQEVLKWYGSREDFIRAHSENQKFICDEKYIMEEEICQL